MHACIHSAKPSAPAQPGANAARIQAAKLAKAKAAKAKAAKAKAAKALADQAEEAGDSTEDTTEINDGDTSSDDNEDSEYHSEDNENTKHDSESSGYENSDADLSSDDEFRGDEGGEGEHEDELVTLRRCPKSKTNEDGEPDIKSNADWSKASPKVAVAQARSLIDAVNGSKQNPVAGAEQKKGAYHEDIERLHGTSRPPHHCCAARRTVPPRKLSRVLPIVCNHDRFSYSVPSARQCEAASVSPLRRVLRPPSRHPHRPSCPRRYFHFEKQKGRSGPIPKGQALLDRYAKVKKASNEWLRVFRSLTRNSDGNTHNESGKSLADAVTEVSQAYGDMRWNNKLKVDASWHQPVMMRLDAYETSLATVTSVAHSPGTGKVGPKKSTTGGTGKTKSKLETALSAVSAKAVEAQKLASGAMVQGIFDRQEEQRAQDREEDAPLIELLRKSLNPTPTAGGELPALMTALTALKTLPGSPATAANIKRVEEKISAAAVKLAGLF